MRVIKIYIFFQIVFIGNIFSQGSEDFNITVPNYKIPFSYYKYIQILDLRADTGNIGFLVSKGLNNTALVIPNPSLQDQIQSILYNCADSSNDGELLLQIRKMKFVQRPYSIDENAYFFLRANLFYKINSNFKEIANIDTLLMVPNSEKNLKEKASDLITKFIINNCNALPKDIENKSYYEILKTDSIEKSKIKIYCAREYIDGVYKTYKSFKNQTPDYIANQIVFRGDDIKKIKKIDSKGKIRKMDLEEIYAVIEKGKIYISAEFGFYSLNKFDGDFFFKGKAEVPSNNAEILLSGIAFGIIGAAVTSQAPKKVYFKIKIDHVDGTFIRGRCLN
jgi:hypothetical protein